MLEIRYNKSTGEVTGWWGNRFGNHEIKLQNRPGEAIVKLTGKPPSQPLAAFLCDGLKLRPNPAFIKPVTAKDDYSQASDNTEKLAVIAQKLGLE